MDDEELRKLMQASSGKAITNDDVAADYAAMLAEMDEYCAYSADKYFEWGMEDPKVAGFFPFYWHTQAGIVGLSNLTKCRAVYEAWGKMVIAGQVPPAATTPTRKFRAPTPGRVCPTPVEKVQHAWCGTHH